jgi:membrane protein
MTIDKRRLVDLGKRLFKEVGEDDLSGGATELAFKLFLALFPFFIFLAALGGFIASAFGVDNPTDRIMNTLGSSLPPDASSMLTREVDGVVSNRNPALLSVGIIGAIWAASSGIGTIMKTTNRVYGVKETRPIWKRYLLAIGLTVLGGTLLIAAFVLAVLGEVFGRKLAGEIGLEGTAAVLLKLARWPVVILLSMVATAFLYWAAPNLKLPFKWISPGAVLFSIGWIVVSFFFALYVSKLGSYNATYGTLGTVVVLLTWFYLTSFILLLGAELNAVLAEEEVPDKLPQTEAEGATPGKALERSGAEESRPAADPREQSSAGPRTSRI